MNANIFQEDLVWSESQHSADWWGPYYKRMFPNSRSISTVPGPSAAQRAGIDKVVTLDSGKRILVDEKIRRTQDGSDILLEESHHPVNGDAMWLGWIEKENQFTDYLAVGFVAKRLAFFFPFYVLQTAWFNNRVEWVAKYGIVKAPNPRINPRYFTHSCPVPTFVLMGHILDAMRIQL